MRSTDWTPLPPDDAVEPASGRRLVVDGSHDAADDGGPGTPDEPFETIGAAAARAEPGDAVTVHDGVYRERVAPTRGGTGDAPITYTAAPGERVAIRGSERWTPDWRPIDADAGIYAGDLDSDLFEGTAIRDGQPARYDPFEEPATLLPGRSLGQVFVDGDPLLEVDDRETLERAPGTWLADGGELIVNLPPGSSHPDGHDFEVTVRDRIFAPRRRGLGHLVVRGFVMEHCANQFPAGFWLGEGETLDADGESVPGWPQAGALGCRSGHDWTIEHNVVRHATAIGVDCGEEGGRDVEGSQPKPEPNWGSDERSAVGHHLIRHNLIADNGACGIAGAGATATRIVGNVVERNNSRGWTAPAFETAGIKTHWFVDGRIEGNLIRDNDAYGIWLDNVYRGGRVTGNVVLNNQWAGIFCEMGVGPCRLDHNVIAFTRTGDGVYTHDSAGVTAAHNLLYANDHYGACMQTVTDRTVRTEDGEVQVATRNQRLLNNVFADNFRGHLALPPESERDRDNESDHNVFVVDAANGHKTAFDGHRFVVGDAADGATDLEGWRDATGNDADSIAVDADRGTIHLSAAERSLEVEGASFLERSCPPVDGLDRDFRDDPLPDEPRPGPFQRVDPGGDRVPLRRRED